MKHNGTIYKYLRWIGLSTLCGVLAGISSGIFLIILDFSTTTRINNSNLIWFLPIAGFAIGLIYEKFGKEIVKGNNLILDEIHDPKKVIPLRMAPLVFFGTIITHLFGGSAGREGTAVQMGGSLSDQISKYFHITPTERKVLLTAGSGAGLAAAIGAPWAGVLFGMEIISIGKFKLFALFQCFIASFVGYAVVHLMGAPHTLYPQIQIPEFQLVMALYIILAGSLFGLSARAFAKTTHTIEDIFKKFIRYAPLRPLLGGILVVLLYQLEGSYKFAGLGLESIQQSLTSPSSYLDPLLKLLFTALTLGAGFKGGEFTPLVFIGATLGSALGFFIPVPFELLAALGFVAVFGGAANAPLSCSILAAEVFGIEILPYALIACYISYYFSGHSGIYKSQRVHLKKHHKLALLFKKLSYK